MEEWNLESVIWGLMPTESYARKQRYRVHKKEWTIHQNWLGDSAEKRNKPLSCLPFHGRMKNH